MSVVDKWTPAVFKTYPVENDPVAPWRKISCIVLHLEEHLRLDLDVDGLMRVGMKFTKGSFHPKRMRQLVEMVHASKGYIIPDADGMVQI